MSAPSAATIQNKLGCSPSLAKSIRFTLLGEPGSEAQIVRTLKEVNFLIGGRGVREVLSEFKGRSVVILTALDEAGLGADVLARLYRRRLLRLDRWDCVRRLFGAAGLDQRLPAHGWLADALIRFAPESGYPPVGTGLLDAATAWSQLLVQALALPAPAASTSPPTADAQSEAVAIAELCLLAGCPERTGEFLAARLSAAQVCQVLLQARADQVEIASHLTVSGTSGAMKVGLSAVLLDSVTTGPLTTCQTIPAIPLGEELCNPSSCTNSPSVTAWSGPALAVGCGTISGTVLLTRR